MLQRRHVTVRDWVETEDKLRGTITRTSDSASVVLTRGGAEGSGGVNESSVQEVLVITVCETRNTGPHDGSDCAAAKTRTRKLLMEKERRDIQHTRNSRMHLRFRAEVAQRALSDGNHISVLLCFFDFPSKENQEARRKKKRL